MLHKTQDLSLYGMLIHLPVSTGRRWFVVRNFKRIVLNFLDSFSKYFSHPKSNLKVLYILPLDEWNISFDHVWINWSFNLFYSFIINIFLLVPCIWKTILRSNVSIASERFTNILSTWFTREIKFFVFLSFSLNSLSFYLFH